jgi:hypothetical protein
MFKKSFVYQKMEQAKQELKNSVRRFRDLDDEIRGINKRVFELREKRKIVEMEVSDYLKSPMFSAHTVMELEDGSRIKIQRPQTWSKGWSLSKKDLAIHIANYFTTASRPNAEECLKYIVQEEKNHSISNEFKLTRFVRDENIENE